MSGVLSGAQQNQAPYHLVVTLNMCKCNAAPEYMATARTVQRLIPAAIGYWEVYKGFWGHLPRMIAVSIVDVRDGTIHWRNGRLLAQEDASEQVSNDAVPHPDPRGHFRGRPGRTPSATRVTGGYGA